MIVKFNPSACLLKKKLQELVKKHNDIAEENEFIESITDSLKKVTQDFIDKMSDVVGSYEIPELDSCYRGIIYFQWEFSTSAPSIFMEISFLKDEVVFVFEDDEKEIRGRESCDFLFQKEGFSEDFYSCYVISKLMCTCNG